MGVRQSEAIGLRWKDVDLETGTIEVGWQLKRARYKHGCDDPVACTSGRHRVRCPPRCTRHRHRADCLDGCVKRGHLVLPPGASEPSDSADERASLGDVWFLAR
jgi:hypothetical protein